MVDTHINHGFKFVRLLNQSFEKLILVTTATAVRDYPKLQLLSS